MPRAARSSLARAWRGDAERSWTGHASLESSFITDSVTKLVGALGAASRPRLDFMIVHGGARRDGVAHACSVSQCGATS